MGLAILNTLIIIRALELGFSHLWISIIYFINAFSMIVISTYLPKYRDLSSLYGHLPHISYGILFISTLVLAVGDKIVFLGGVVSTFVFSYVIYYLIYLSIRSNGYINKSRYVSRFETLGGLAWALGLVLGFLISFYIDTQSMFRLVSLIPLSGLVLSFKYFHFYGNRASLSVFGLLPNMFFSRFKIYFSRCSISPVSRFRGIWVSREFLYVVFLVNLSISFFYTRLIPYEYSLGFPKELIFSMVLVSSTTSLLSYNYHGDNFRGKSSFIDSLLFRAFTYFFFIVVFFMSYESSLYTYFLHLAFFMFLGFSGSYISINLSSIILRFREREISVINLFSGMGSLFGILLSGLFSDISMYYVMTMFSLFVVGCSIFISMRYPITRVVYSARYVMDNNIIIWTHNRASVSRHLSMRAS
jgi:hypothetical protein